MKQKFWQGMTTAVAATILGVTGVASTSETKAVASQAETTPMSVDSQLVMDEQPSRIEIAHHTKRKYAKITDGVASWYGPGFHGRISANGEIYDQNALTAAHKTLPFDSVVRVTNLRNGRSVVVRINDRGPYVGERIIDLSAAAARKIGMINKGVDRVRVELLKVGSGRYIHYRYRK